MSTMVLELLDFIDPNLTWKTVSKGRNTTRRSRRRGLKTVRMGQEQEEGAKRVDSPDSGPVKSSVTSFRLRFGDNMEHIPIKKRRFLFQSTSTCQCPQTDYGKQYNDQAASDQQACPDFTLATQNLEFDSSKESESSIDKKTVKMTNDALGGSEDFSGIAILAAAACGDGLEMSADCVGQTLSGSLVGGNQNDLCGFSSAGIRVEEFVEPTTNDFVKTFDGTRTSGAQRDVRMHWDLNTPTDQWNHPLDDTIGDLGRKVDNIQELGSTHTTDESTFQPSEVGHCLSETLPGSSHPACGLPNLNTEECSAGLSSCMRSNFLTAKCVFSSKKSCNDSNVPLQTVDTVASVDYSLCLGSNEGKTSLPLENQKTASDPMEATTLDAAYFIQAEKCEHMGIAFMQTPGLTRATCETDDARDPLEATNENPASFLQIGKGEHTEIAFTQISGLEKDACDTDDAYCKFKVNTDKTGDVNDGNNELQDVRQQSGPFPFDLEKEHAPLHVSPSEEVVIHHASNSLHFEDSKDFIEAEVKQGGSICLTVDYVLGDVRKCDVELLRPAGSAVGTCNIDKCRDDENGKRRNDLDLTKGNNSEATHQFIDTPTGDVDRISSGLSDTGFFCCSIKSEELGASSASLGNKQSVEPAHAKVAKGKSEQHLIHEAHMCTSLEMSSTAKAFGKQVNVPAKNSLKVHLDGEATHQFIDTPTGDSDRISSELIDTGFFHCSRKSEEMSLPSASLDDKKSVEPACAKVAKGKSEDIIHEAHICMSLEMSSVAEAYDKQVNVSTNNLLVHLEDSLDNIVPCSLASHEAQCQITSAAGLEGGLDSHLEDGELRESVEHCMQDNECEDVEAEHVDCNSDNGDEYKFTDAANSSVELAAFEGECGKQSSHLDPIDCKDGHGTFMESIEANNACHSKSGAECFGREAVMDNRDVVGVHLDKNQENSVACVDIDMGVNDASGTASDGPGVRDSGLKSLGRDLQSHIEGPVSSDSRDAFPVGRSRSRRFNYAYHRDSRLISDDAPLDRGGPMHMDGGGGARFRGHSWNRLKSIVADAPGEDDDAKFLRGSGGTTGRRCRPVFSTSRIGYAHYIRRRSPAERNDDSFRPVKVQDMNPDFGSRSRYPRHPFPCGISGGFREGHRRPVVYETAHSSGSMPSRFARRERSFSPICTRTDSSHKGSRSRSGTRSPDLRLEDRTGRLRMRYPPFAIANHQRERRSPGRVISQHQRFHTVVSEGRLKSDGCFRPVLQSVRFSETSPSGRSHEFEESDGYKRKHYIPRSRRRSRSRSISPIFRSETRMRTMRPIYQSASHMRDRRSPGRMFHTRHRFDTLHSPERLRSDDYSRPIMRPARFADTALLDGGNEGDNDDYRRKPSSIFERIRPIRDYDMEGGDIRRFDCDAEDIIMAQGFCRDDIYVRGAERRPVGFSRGTREDRSNARYNSERIHYSSSKQFGMRVYGDNVLPRQV